MNLLPRLALLFIVSLFAHCATAQFVENQGQFNPSVRFRLQLPNGFVYFENGGFTYFLYDAEQVHALHEQAHEEGQQSIENATIDAFAYRVKLANSTAEQWVGSGKKQHYQNFFIGNNRSQWKSRVPLFDTITYTNVYPGIDLRCNVQPGGFKYEFVVRSGADAAQIQLDYDELVNVDLKDGELHVAASKFLVTEQKPVSFYTNKKNEVIPCRYVLNNHRLTFELENYRKAETLIIDPSVVASTNIGSTGTNFGHSATYDAYGNIYGGSRVLAPGYPATSGAIQLNFAGSADMGVTKISADGTTLLWSTHLGGVSEDYVHSMVVNGLNGVVVYGKTNSVDFPTTINAFDTSHNGGFDIALAVFNEDGDSLLGSTYLGGADSDGNNIVPAGSYGTFKGEVEVDAYSNVYVASTSSSSDFPVSGGAYRDTIAGAQDGVVVKLSFDLGFREWATFVGGTQSDGAFGVKIADDQSLFVVGMTMSSDFETTTDVVQDTFAGGVDAFIIHLSADGTNLLRSTLYGDAQTNTGLFIQIDRFDDIYILGAWPGLQSTTGKYQGPATSPSSYIAKFNVELDTVFWVSTFAGLAHSAFLVDNCRNLYAAGNGAPGPTQVDISADAIDTNQQGFYVMVLHPEADSLKYATYYGNSGSHVDGGTSRFDKRGMVYQATCSAGFFPQSNNAWSTNQNGGTYDLTLFKIDFDIDAAVAQIQVGANSNVAGCAPHTVSFSNIGSVGLDHFWDFGDGATDTTQTPTHTFDSAGTYFVMYAVSDTAGCILEDTAYIVIQVYDTLGPEIEFEDPVCLDTVPLTLNAPFSQILWSTGNQTSTIAVSISGTYWAQVSNVCGVYYDTVDVEILGFLDLGLRNDTAVCDESIMLTVNAGADSYAWSTGDTTQFISADSTGIYYIIAILGVCVFEDSVDIEINHLGFVLNDTVVCDTQLTVDFSQFPGDFLWSTGDTTAALTFTENGTYWLLGSNDLCTNTDTFLLNFRPITLDLPADTAICSPLEIDAFSSDYTDYLWFDGSTNSSITITGATLVWLQVSNGSCTTTDTIRVNLVPYVPETDPLQLYCDTAEVILSVPDMDGATVTWSTGDSSNSIAVDQSGSYSVLVAQGTCLWRDTFEVKLGFSPQFDLPDISFCEGDSFEVSIDSTFTSYFWSTTETGPSMVVRDSGLYTLNVSNNGCETSRSFRVTYSHPLMQVSNYVANVITPNNDGINDALKIRIKDFSAYNSWELQVFNRWGMNVFRSDAPNLYWDGRTQFGEPLEEGVYYYSIEGTTYCLEKDRIFYQGSITILR